MHLGRGFAADLDFVLFGQANVEIFGGGGEFGRWQSRWRGRRRGRRGFRGGVIVGDVFAVVEAGDEEVRGAVKVDGADHDAAEGGGFIESGGAGEGGAEEGGGGEGLENEVGVGGDCHEGTVAGEMCGGKMV